MRGGRRQDSTGADSTAAAQAAGLYYVSSEKGGIRRERAGAGFRYLDSRGKTIRDPAVLKRIKSLAIPPAWREVWICSNPLGHLQATGRDDRGRKQHRYHRRWREVRDEHKYNRMIPFAEALPRIRRKVHEDLAEKGLSRNCVLATVVQLLETSLIRVGNDEYARQNRSFGLTTLKDKHVIVSGPRIRFRFRGKSGKDHEVDVEDQRLARIVRGCRDIPGQELFQYFDSDGRRRDVTSGDVNTYLREITCDDFSAKDFRTWAGTVLAASALAEAPTFQSARDAKRTIGESIEKVARRLGNTPAICRKCYVHPTVLEAYIEGTLGSIGKFSATGRNGSRSGLRREEKAVLKLLRRRLRAASVPLEELLRKSLARLKPAARG